jgi:hypothetical protein
VHAESWEPVYQLENVLIDAISAELAKDFELYHELFDTMCGNDGCVSNLTLVYDGIVSSAILLRPGDLGWGLGMSGNPYDLLTTGNACLEGICFAPK